MRILATLPELGSFTKTAESLSFGQKASVSKSLQQLESHLASIAISY